MDLAVAEVDVARAENYLQRLQFALTPIQGADRYEFIIVDCPPSLGILTMNALAAVDSVLVPMQAEYFALEGLAVITRVLQQIRDSGANPSLELQGIVLTMYDGRTNLAQQVAAEVRKHFPGKVYKTVIPRTVRLARGAEFWETDYDVRFGVVCGAVLPFVDGRVAGATVAITGGCGTEQATAGVETPRFADGELTRPPRQTGDHSSARVASSTIRTSSW